MLTKSEVEHPVTVFSMVHVKVLVPEDPPEMTTADVAEFTLEMVIPLLPEPCQYPISSGPTAAFAARLYDPGQ
jgi:hypothetical protein